MLFAMGLHRCKFELLQSVCEMYDQQRALIVVVLVDVTEQEVPPCLRCVSLVDMRRDPNYQHKLMSILKGGGCLLCGCQSGGHAP